MASEKRLRVLLDANVIFSGFHGSGSPSLIIDAAGEAFEVVVTTEVIKEVFRNLSRKVPHLVVAAEEWFAAVDAQVWDADPDEILQWEDPFGKDAHVVAAAFAVDIDYLATGDGGPRSGMLALQDAPPVLTPRELLDLLTL